MEHAPSLRLGLRARRDRSDDLWVSNDKVRSRCAGLSIKILPIKLPQQPRPVGMVTLKHRTLSQARIFLFVVCKTLLRGYHETEKARTASALTRDLDRDS